MAPVAERRLHDVCVEGSGVTDRQEVKRRITSGPSVKNGHASAAWRERAEIITDVMRC